jgi:hypothetical protein
VFFICADTDSQAQQPSISTTHQPLTPPHNTPITLSFHSLLKALWREFEGPGCIATKQVEYTRVWFEIAEHAVLVVKKHRAYDVVLKPGRDRLDELLGSGAAESLCGETGIGDDGRLHLKMRGEECVEPAAHNGSDMITAQWCKADADQLLEERRADARAEGFWGCGCRSCRSRRDKAEKRRRESQGARAAEKRRRESPGAQRAAGPG